ncbi:MAG: hypothetical protein NC091_05555 [Bacteroides sp.]|nr:hypothetical protein [Bacteroides sp.]
MANVTNNSTNAVNKNVIIPEVYASLVDEKILGKVVISQAAEVLGDLMGQPGEVLNMPAWIYPGDASDIAVGTAIPAEKLKQTNRQATIKMVAPKGIAVNDYDDAVAFGRALEKAADFQSTGISRKIDTDLITASYTTPLKYKLANDGEITFDEANGILSLYGDDANAEDFSFLAIHSAYIPSFLKMDGFVSAEVTHTKDDNGIMVNNLLGYFRGIKVVVSDRLYNEATQEKFILAIKKGSLGIIPKETVHVELARDASTRTTTIYTSQYYAVARIDDSGIVLAKKTLPTAE